MIKAVIINIYGRVQGVNFRSFTLQSARDLGLSGYVKNLSDGGVYVQAQGEERDLIKFIELIKAGPRLAEVKKVEQNWHKSNLDFDGFYIQD